MSGGGETNQVSEYKPPDWSARYYDDYTQRAYELASKPTEQYQGATVAPMTAQHMTGQNMLMNLAQNGTAAGNAGNSMLYNTLMGGFDNPYATTLNPYAGQSAYTSGVIDQANQKTTDAYSRAMTANNRNHALSRTMGSDKQLLQQEQQAQALAEGLANNATNAYDRNFYANQGLAEAQLGRATSAVEAERGRQMQAAGMAPQQQQMDLAAIQALMGGGDAQRNYQQELLNAQVSDFWRAQQDPAMRLDLLGNALTRGGGGAGTTSQQIMGGMNPMVGLLGLGGLGYSMFGGGK